MKTSIINTNIIMQDYIIPNSTIVMEDGIIVDFGKKICTEGMECIDACGAYTGPGLIDIYTADGDYFFFKNPVEAAATVLQHGITDVMPAVYFDATAEQP